MALKSGQSQMSHGARWELPVGEMIPVLMGAGKFGKCSVMEKGKEERQSWWEGREDLADELFLLAFCQVWNVLWSHGADAPLGFHDRSEFRALNQEQQGELGCLINQLRLMAVS